MKKYTTKGTKVALLVVIVLIVIALYFGFEMRETIYDGYAAWNTTKTVAAYIVRNDGLLPTKWSDLVNADPNYDSRAIESFKERIEIDFAQKPPRIEIISGRAPAWNKPNEEIAQLIKESKIPLNQRKSIYWFINYDRSGPLAEQDEDGQAAAAVDSKP
ncbi:MAG: hypothetical protein R3F19_32895 [Verrucomicrobiales bacterium]